MKRVALRVAWPAFLMAGLLEMLVFGAVDPADLSGWVGRALAGWSAPGVYTLAFFGFWAVCALGSTLTLRLVSRARR